MILYEGNWTFDVPEWAQSDGGWTPDCNRKQDFDPTLLSFSCRVYGDADYICSLYLGEHQIVTSGVLSAASVEAAKLAVRQWCEEQAARVIAALAAQGIEAATAGETA